MYPIAEDTDVTIEVYNLPGKEIKIIVSSRAAAGYYTATRNGVDDHNYTLSSGIYFIRMQAKSFSMVRKVSLMR